MATFDKVSRKKGTGWRARVRVGTHPPSQKTFDKKGDAKTWATQQEYKIKMNKILPELESKKHTVNDLCKRYLEKILVTDKDQHDRKKGHLSHFRRGFGFKTLADLNKSDISNLVEELGKEITCRKTVRKQSTVARYVSTLNHCFEYGVNDLEWIPSNIVKKVSKPKESPPSTRYLEPDEFTKLLSQINITSPRLSRLFLVLAFSGMRVGEALSIKAKDFSVEDNCVIIRKTKNKEIRRVSIFGAGFESLSDLIEKNKSRGRDWQPFGGNSSKNYQSFRRLLIKSMDACKVKGFGFHGLRHTVASYLAMSGSQLQDIAEILGHKSIKMAARYSHLMEKHTKNKMQKLSESVINPLVSNN